jgi:nickel transport protein
MFKKISLYLLLALAAVVLSAGLAGAHKTNVFAYVEDGRLMGEGYFPGGGKAQGCQVEVFDAGGKLLGTAKTDAQGQFSMPLPQGRAPFKVILKAGEGHRADYSLSAQELGLADGGQPAPAAASAQPAAPAPAAAGAAVSQAALEKSLGRLLDQKLGPIKAQLARLSGDRGISVHDVVAGLGYILGLMGLAAYMRFRRQGGGR